MTEAVQDQEPSLGEASYPATLFTCENSLKNAQTYQQDSPLKLYQNVSDVLDSNPLLETGSVILSEGFGLCDDEISVPLCGIETNNLQRTEESAIRSVSGTKEAKEQGEDKDELEDSKEKKTEELLDRPPANSKLKFIDVPKVATSAEIPSLLSRVRLEQCPECYCLSDECTLCEESSARQLIAAYTGAADPSGGLNLPEWSTYTKPTKPSSEKHSVSELSDLIQKIETFQADGFVAKVRDRFKHASRALKGAILFCVDSGASDHICCQKDAFETLNLNAPSKLFKVVHGTARIRSEGVGTVLIPVMLPDGKVVRIRLYLSLIHISEPTRR